MTLHGGPVVGLLAWAVEQAVADPTLMCSRLTVEMLRAVPLEALDTSAEVVKPGRRSVVIDAELRHQGQVVARASSQWLPYNTDLGPSVAGTGTPGPTSPPRPERASDPRATSEFEYPNPGFNADTGELRYLEGSHEEEGPGVSWLRFLSPLIAGEANSAFVKTALVSDLAAAAGWERSPTGSNYINPDVTLQRHREPTGEWLALDSRAEHTGNGIGLMAATLFDDSGPFGRVLQSLVETPMQLDAQTTR